MTARIRLAFLGFRHGHVMSLYQAAADHPGVEVVAAAEEDPATADSLEEAGSVKLSHDRYADVLRDVDCDAIAVGDYFARRGEVAIAALEAGKHVIADKPICTRLDELARIEHLAAEERRVVSCLLDLRDHGGFRAMRRLVLGGEVGEVHTVTFTAQHPLMPGKRPAWYFEPGKHGGTINDIAVHAVDLIPWMTGRRLTEVVAARAWNARLPQHPHFQDAAQLMLGLDNGGGVLGDVSYLAPEASGYQAPQYWRVTCHGDRGVVEAGYTERVVRVATSTDTASRTIPAEPDSPRGRIDDFLRDVAGEAGDGSLTTRDVIAASRQSLLIQEAADHRRRDVKL